MTKYPKTIETIKNALFSEDKASRDIRKRYCKALVQTVMFKSDQVRFFTFPGACSSSGYRGGPHRVSYVCLKRIIGPVPIFQVKSEVSEWETALESIRRGYIQNLWFHHGHRFEEDFFLIKRRKSTRLLSPKQIARLAQYLFLDYRMLEYILTANLKDLDTWVWNAFHASMIKSFKICCAYQFDRLSNKEISRKRCESALLTSAIRLTSWHLFKLSFVISIRFGMWEDWLHTAREGLVSKCKKSYDGSHDLAKAILPTEELKQYPSILYAEMTGDILFGLFGDGCLAPQPMSWPAGPVAKIRKRFIQPRDEFSADEPLTTEGGSGSLTTIDVLESSSPAHYEMLLQNMFSPDEVSHKAYVRGLLQTAGLEEHESELLILNQLEGVTYDEISRMLNEKPDTVRRRGARAIKKLQNFFC